MNQAAAYCPNCSAPLSSDAVASCGNCDATFTHKDGWKPVKRPPGKFVARVKVAREKPAGPPEPPPPPLSLGYKLLKIVLALPLLVVGGFLAALTSKSAGATLPFALAFFAFGGALLMARRGPLLTFLIVTTVLVLGLVWLVLFVLRAASFAR